MGILERTCVCGHESRIDPNPDCERCVLVWTLAKVRHLRRLQRDFFAARDRTEKAKLLGEAKRVERIVDAAIDRMQEKQRTFFDA